MLSSCALNLLFALAPAHPRAPWPAVPLALYGCGVQLAFPTLTLLLLDRFPEQRGGVSSVQAFGSLIFTAIVAGILSPGLSGSMLSLAIGTTCMCLIGLGAWLAYASLERRRLARTPAAAAS